MEVEPAPAVPHVPPAVALMEISPAPLAPVELLIRFVNVSLTRTLADALGPAFTTSML